jgi:hypothetical protein
MNSAKKSGEVIGQVAQEQSIKRRFRKFGYSGCKQRYRQWLQSEWGSFVCIIYDPYPSGGK